MSSEIIQNVAYDIIMMIFNMSTSYFHKISFHYFEDLFNDKFYLRLRLIPILIRPCLQSSIRCSNFMFISSIWLVFYKFPALGRGPKKKRGVRRVGKKKKKSEHTFSSHFFEECTLINLKRKWGSGCGLWSGYGKPIQNCRPPKTVKSNQQPNQMCQKHH
jgi:hypothetical protein